MARRTVLLLVLLLCVPVLAFAGERKQVAERAGCVITVGERDNRGTDLVIGTCHWDVDASKIIPVVSAATSHVFLSSLDESRALPDGRIHQVHNASGISDREITLDFTTEKLSDGVKVSWTASAKQEAVHEDHVRVAVDDGYWEVHDLGGGKSQVIYGLRYNAGGKVPEWLVRSFQKTGVGDILQEMLDEVSK
ncbi:MAG: hypothetical protein GY898_13320 [Proteobacteria bacterium]|nr:hypothetical protein [Pseudomonadota bacterium]